MTNRHCNRLAAAYYANPNLYRLLVALQNPTRFLMLVKANVLTAAGSPLLLPPLFLIDKAMPCHANGAGTGAGAGAPVCPPAAAQVLAHTPPILIISQRISPPLTYLTRNQL